MEGRLKIDVQRCISVRIITTTLNFCELHSEDRARAKREYRVWGSSDYIKNVVFRGPSSKVSTAKAQNMRVSLPAVRQYLVLFQP